MTDSEKLDRILTELLGVKEDVGGLKEDVGGLKEDVSGLKQDVSDLKQDMTEVKRRVTNLELHIENVTDRNIQILAENYINLITKLNEAIPAVNKEQLYQIKVDYLTERMERMERTYRPASKNDMNDIELIFSSKKKAAE